MLASCARRINQLEAQIKGAQEEAEQTGAIDLPVSVYVSLDEIRLLREKAATATISSTQEAILALGLATNGRDCSEARLIRRVMAFLAEP